MSGSWKASLLTSLLVLTTTAVLWAATGPSVQESTPAVERGLCAPTKSTLGAEVAARASGPRGFAAFLNGTQPIPMAGVLGCQFPPYGVCSYDCGSCVHDQDCGPTDEGGSQVCLCIPYCP